MENSEEFSYVEVGADDKRVKTAKRIGIIALALSVICSGIATAACIQHKSTVQADIASAISSSSPDTSGGDTSWIPSDYTAWSNDSNVAYKWVKQPCGDYTCNHAAFITQNGCSSFYAAVNFLDSGDNVIGYGNATLPSLQPMQSAILQFDDTSNSASSSQMSEINCR
jgi:hypothetical protein